MAVVRPSVSPADDGRFPVAVNENPMRHLLLAASLAACSITSQTRTVTTVAARSHVVVATDPVATPSAPLVVASDGGLRCSPPQRALAGTAVRLRAEGPPGLRYRWSVTRSPQARYYRFSERFDANDSDSIVALGPEVPFTSVIVGDYTVVAEARDPDGAHDRARRRSPWRATASASSSPGTPTPPTSTST